jgi:hypothetical protein
LNLRGFTSCLRKAQFRFRIGGRSNKGMEDGANSTPAAYAQAVSLTLSVGDQRT